MADKPLDEEFLRYADTMLEDVGPTEIYILC